MKICSIDIGTNSVLYLLSQIDKLGRLRPLTFEAKTTRLGKSLRDKDTLNLQAQRRTITSIKQFLKDAHQKGALHYIMVGTSALREAKNAPKFIQRIYQETGKHLIILTENKEAKLVFSAVKHYLGIKSDKAVIADIGGGSTELIFCKKEKPVYPHTNNISVRVKTSSIPIGAVNLTERFRNDIEKMEEFVKIKIKHYTSWEKPTRLIGVGGTVTTLGAVLQNLKTYDSNKVHRYIVTTNQLIHTLKRLNRLNLKERKKLLLFDPKRADIIVAGLVILKIIMELFNVEKVRISDRGLVYGLALSYSPSMPRVRRTSGDVRRENILAGHSTYTILHRI